MMNTTVQPWPDTRLDLPPAIPSIPTVRRPRRAACEQERTRLSIRDEITEVEWLLPFLTPTEIAHAVGRSSAAALIRWLIRIERWDLAILCGPKPLDPRKIVQVEEDLEAARWRVLDLNRLGIEWALAWVVAGQLADTGAVAA